MLMVEIKAPVARWKQVADYLREQIHNGTFAAGQALPSEQQLAEEFGLSRPTIRQAINDLRGAGLIEVRRPMGTFVRSPQARPAISEQRAMSLSPQGYAQANALAWENVDDPTYVRIDATAAHADLLNVTPGEPMLVRTVLQACGNVRRAHRLYMPFSVAADTPWADDPALPEAHELYGYFAEKKAKLQWREHVRARMPLPDEVESLEVVPGTPLVQVTRVTLDKEKPLLMEEIVARGDALEVVYSVPVSKTSR
jgi:GntR family transcriptional regulator